MLFKLQYREWCDLQTCVGLFIIYYRDVGLGHIRICLVVDTFHPSEPNNIIASHVVKFLWHDHKLESEWELGRKMLNVAV